jgi:mannitol/fructose-specific phosphotransferase system IIA component (Ntr-type)
MERQQRLMEEPLFVPSRVRLGLVAGHAEAAVRATAELLRGAPGLSSWDELWQSIASRQTAELSGGVCLAHGRIASLAEPLVAAARLAAPVPGTKGPVRFVFVFAIPAAMAEEYLRTVGALARCCGDAKKMKALQAADTPEKFARLAAEWTA